VPGAGLEPARPCGQRILSPPRLPFRHPGRVRRDHDTRPRLGWWPSSTRTWEPIPQADVLKMPGPGTDADRMGPAVSTVIQVRDDGFDRAVRTARYRAAIGRVPHIVILIDASGRILDASDGVTGKLGYSIDDVLGRSVFDFLHPADHEQAAIEILRELEPDSQAESITCRLRHADDRWMQFEVLGTNQLEDPDIGGVIVGLRDVSARRIGDRVLAAGNYLYSSLAMVASDATTIFDRHGQRVYVSASLGSMLGYTQEQLLAIPPQGLVYPDDVHLWKNATREALATVNGTSRTEVRLLRSDGQPLWIEATVVNLLKDLSVKGVVVHARDIDARRRMEHALRLQATRDPLTGLANRFAFMEELGRLKTVDTEGRTTGCNRSGSAVLFCDLDGFKAINDTYGHAAGDKALIDVANRIALAVRPSDFVARIGGDEFCVLCRSVDTPAAAVGLAERVRDAIGTDSPLNGSRKIQLGVSVGVAWTHNDSSGDAGQLLTIADRAMYRAKNRGPNLVELGEHVSS
jgi:diguanylate cyclase (GGDEF)-like protein/PAS domain S-box-containing protein